MFYKNIGNTHLLLIIPRLLAYIIKFIKQSDDLRFEIRIFFKVYYIIVKTEPKTCFISQMIVCVNMCVPMTDISKFGEGEIDVLALLK